MLRADTKVGGNRIIKHNEYRTNKNLSDYINDSLILLLVRNTPLLDISREAKNCCVGVSKKQEHENTEV